eukprot:g7899.t1
MLAALRSIVPDEWNMDHEMAWNWLWESVERIISSTISFPRAYEKTIRTFLFEQSEANMNQLRAQTYSCFFQRCPSGQEPFRPVPDVSCLWNGWLGPCQDHFKQSTTRLYFILDRNYEMVLEIFENPAKVVEDLSALGLRHVGFGEAISQAFTWSETLISKILMRVILEGSTIVMKAINLNEEAALRKAISVAPRGQRAQQLLNITAGTQSFSPLFWAIDSGSLNSAKAIIQDPERREAKRGERPARARRTTMGFVKATALGGRIASHPCMILATDMVWFKFATFYFLLSRGYFLFTLLVFASGQTILVRHQEMETQEETRRWNHHPSDGRERYVMLGCRLFLYMVVMPAMLANFVMLCMRDVHSRHMSRLCGLPIPASLKEFDKALRLCLLWVMVFLSCTEPMLWCMSLAAFRNSGSQELAFLTDCPEISTEMKTIYGILSAFGMLLFWLLLSDFSVFSTRISAFLLVCSHVISEVGLFMMALAVLLIAFATSVNALNHHLEDFDGVHVWLRALFQIVLGMFPVSNYDRFQDEAAVMAFVSVFIILAARTGSGGRRDFPGWVPGCRPRNLLVAQLNQSYHLKFCDMKGNARLRRARVICSVMASSAPAKHWRRFLDSLGFEQRLEFNEGDIGIAGGLQVLEPASAITVTFDAVKRYGGSTAPTMPWPPEVEVADMEQDRYERLEKLLLKGIHRHGKSHGKKNSMLGSSSLMSDDISDSNNGLLEARPVGDCSRKEDANIVEGEAGEILREAKVAKRVADRASRFAWAAVFICGVGATVDLMSASVDYRAALRSKEELDEEEAELEASSRGEASRRVTMDAFSSLPTDVKMQLGESAPWVLGTSGRANRATVPANVGRPTGTGSWSVPVSLTAPVAPVVAAPVTLPTLSTERTGDSLGSTTNLVYSTSSPMASQMAPSSQAFTYTSASPVYSPSAPVVRGEIYSSPQNSRPGTAEVSRSLPMEPLSAFLASPQSSPPLPTLSALQPTVTPMEAVFSPVRGSGLAEAAVFSPVRSSRLVESTSQLTEVTSPTVITTMPPRSVVRTASSPSPKIRKEVPSPKIITRQMNEVPSILKSEVKVATMRLPGVSPSEALQRPVTGSTNGGADAVLVDGFWERCDEGGSHRKGLSRRLSSSMQDREAESLFDSFPDARKDVVNQRESYRATKASRPASCFEGLFKHQDPVKKVDVLLVGGGIMSATLALLLKQLEPDWKIAPGFS